MPCPFQKSEFLSAIQARVPGARIEWDRPPSLSLDMMPCSFTATDIKDPSNVFVGNLPQGIGEEPFDDLVDEFVHHIIRDLHL